jgi:RNase P protein component
MKITRNKLRRIIREELSVIKEQSAPIAAKEKDFVEFEKKVEEMPGDPASKLEALKQEYGEDLIEKIKETPEILGLGNDGETLERMVRILTLLGREDLIAAELRESTKKVSRDELRKIIREAMLSEASAADNLDAAEELVRKPSPTQRDWSDAQTKFRAASDDIIGATEESEGINQRNKNMALADIRRMRSA